MQRERRIASALPRLSPDSGNPPYAPADVRRPPDSCRENTFQD